MAHNDDPPRRCCVSSSFEMADGVTWVDEDDTACLQARETDVFPLNHEVDVEDEDLDIYVCQIQCHGG